MSPRDGWTPRSLLGPILLVLSVVASLGATAIFWFVIYLFIGGYSGGSSPANVAPVLFPIAIFIFVVAGLPAMLICVVLWAAYGRTRARRAARPSPS